MKKHIAIFPIVFCMSFFLGAQTIRVTSPAGGENWCQNTEHAVTWTSAGAMARTVKIVLMTATGTQPVVDSTENDGSYPWRIPATLAPGSYRLRVKTTDNAVMHTSPPFTVCTATLVAMVQPRVVSQPAAFTHTLTLPVTFATKMKHREKHQWNCLATMGTGPIAVPPNEFLIGFQNRCADRGPLCADECASQLYRGSPLFDAARLSPLAGKTLIRATLSFRHKASEAEPACAFCLARIEFFAGGMGDMNPPVSEIRPVSAAALTAYVRIDLTDWLRNWLREHAPGYSGERHNYHMEFVGTNERLDYNNQKCLSWFDDGSLEITYRD